MSADEEVRLTLKTSGFDAMKGIASDATAAAQSYQVLAVSGQGFEIEEQRVASAMDLAVKAAIEQTQAQKALNLALEESTAASGKSATSKQKLGYALQSTAYAAQDFTSQLGTRGLAGALGAVQNNIPLLVTQLGGAAGLAGAIGIVSVAAGVLYENWDKVAAMWSPAKTAELPALGSGLDGIARSLKAINTEIEDLEKRSLTDVLSHPDVVRLGKLRGLRAEGTKQHADLRMVEGVGPLEDKRSREIAAAVKAAIAEAGGGESVAQTLRGNLGGSYQDAVAVVASAMRGNTTDLEILKKQSPAFGREFRRVDPIEKAQNELAKKGFAEEKARIEARQAANAKQAAAIDDLNDEGRSNETAFREGVDRDAAREAKNAERERAKAEAAETPGARLRAFRDQAFQAAAGMAIRENNGEFAPAQLESIAREAANQAGGLDGDSIRQALYQAAAMTRARMQADLNRQMMRLQNASDSYYSPY